MPVQTVEMGDDGVKWTSKINNRIPTSTRTMGLRLSASGASQCCLAWYRTCSSFASNDCV